MWKEGKGSSACIQTEYKATQIEYAGQIVLRNKQTVTRLSGEH
jgi:hypothetical protein